MEKLEAMVALSDEEMKTIAGEGPNACESYSDG